ncbi:serine hydrolase domain-containing protein [Evansella sp. AB-rgal1]|uniref:serine hydrolase domain-containing protein n=1 Tax=Evansella sp. AB-rgal1 TaxID=3242696 RepID=UPI00359D5D37
MKKRYIVLLFVVLLLFSLGIVAFVLGSTTHSNLKGTNTERLHTFMVQKTKELDFNGTVLVVRDEEVLLSEGYGYADLDNQVENSPDTIFNIASLSKSFTAVAILQLEEQGRLSIKDSITKYLADFPTRDDITVHHLLTHTSGLPELLSLVEHSKTHSLEELYEAVKNEELEFEPGKKYAYSNSGYLLLAMIIEQQSGMSLAEYIQANILDPAGMEHTYFEQSPEVTALGYENMGNISDLIDISIAYGAGNMLSTTGDLYLFDKAINEGQLLNQEQVEKMQNGYVNAAPFGIVKYGYGWNVSDSWYSYNRKSVAHAGGFPGFKNFFLRFPEENLTIVVLSNNQGKWSPSSLALELASIIFEERFWHIIN